MNIRLLAPALCLIPALQETPSVPATPRAAKLAFHQLSLRLGASPSPERDRLKVLARRALNEDPHVHLTVNFARALRARLSPLRVTSAPGGTRQSDDFDRRLPELFAALDRESFVYEELGIADGDPSTPSELMSSVLDAPKTPFASQGAASLREWSGNIVGSVEHLRFRATWANDVAADAREATGERAEAISEAVDPICACLQAYLALFDGAELVLPEDPLDAVGPLDETARAWLESGTPDDIDRLERMAHSSVRAEQVAGTRALVRHGFDLLVRGELTDAAGRGLDAYLSGVPHRLRYRALVLYCLAAEPAAAERRLDSIDRGRLDPFFTPRLPLLRRLKRAWEARQSG